MPKLITTRMNRNDANGMTPEFVRAVNLAYHEEEAAEYDSRHPEIFKDELGHWSLIADRVASLKKGLGRPLKVVDIGSGTGFVPMRLAGVLDAQDEFVLTDLSPMMLDRARESLTRAGFRPKTSYVVADAESTGLAPASMDVVTMNSVVHHLPSLEKAFAAIDRLVRPGGLVVIAHEPNLRHFQHPIVGNVDRFMRLLRRWRAGKPRTKAQPSAFIEKVNARLIAAGTIGAPLTAEKIESIVDIHSPTAGRTVDATRGVDPFALSDSLLPGYAIQAVQTYRHFGKLDVMKRPWLARVQRAFEKLWPRAGALFLVILKKPAR